MYIGIENNVKNSPKQNIKRDFSKSERGYAERMNFNCPINESLDADKQPNLFEAAASITLNLGLCIRHIIGRPKQYIEVKYV